MDSIAIWIALGAVFIALIPVFLGAAAKARRKRAAEVDAHRRGDGGSVTSAGTVSGDGRKSLDHDSDGGWGSDGSGGDGGGGGGD